MTRPAKTVKNRLAILKVPSPDRCQTVRRFDKRQCIRSLGHGGFCWFDRDAQDFEKLMENPIEAPK